MRHWWTLQVTTFIVAALFQTASTLHAVEAIPNRVLENLRASMVLVQCPGGATGSGFVVEQNKKFYVFTASHVCVRIKPGQEVGCTVKSKPQDQFLKCKLVAYENFQDIAIYSLPDRDFSVSPVKLSLEKVLDGTEIGFSGYPYAIHTTFMIVTRKGMVSNRLQMVTTLEDPRTKQKKEIEHEYLIIDGLSSPGDSGGPVFLSTTGEVVAMTTATTGILKDYSLTLKHGDREIDVSDKPTGILLAVPVSRILDLLKSALPTK